MTRINAVPPAELVDGHLIAEYHELPRVFGLVRKAQAKGLTPWTIGAPTAYVLGPGHLLFFYDKCRYLVHRQRALTEEMRRRGLNPRYDNAEELIEGLDGHWLNDWEPTPTALYLSRLRLRQRLDAIRLRRSLRPVED